MNKELKPWKSPFRWQPNKTKADKRRWAIRKRLNERAKAQNLEGEERLDEQAAFYEHLLPERLNGSSPA